jgi:zinc protease
MRIREPEGWAERRLLLQGDDPTPFWTQAYRAPAALHPDFFPMVVADAVLGGAKGLGLFGGSANARATRLYRALVDAGLAVDAGSSYLPALDENLFSFSATPAPDVDPAAVEAAVLGEIERLKQEPVAEAELHKAIKQMRAQFAFGSESVTWQAYWLATWDARLSAVTPDDVQRVAQTYFVANRRTTGLYLPDPAALADNFDNNADDTDDSGEEEAE